MSSRIMIAILNAVLMVGEAFAQPGSTNFGRVWMQGESIVYTTTFPAGLAPLNQIAFLPQAMPPYLTSGNSNICDSLGNLLLISDGFNLYNANLEIIDGGYMLVPGRIFRLQYGYSNYVQSSIILPFSNGKYRLVTPTVSDDSCYYNWERMGNGAVYDMLLYDEVDINANAGAGKVTKRMIPLLQNVRLSKTQMMACRHGDGKSWWLLKQAADTNLVYKFLFTEDQVYGPYVQGFSGDASNFGNWDLCGQAMFSNDGTKYATGIQGHGSVFLADFDRCSGVLSNPSVYKVPAQLTGGHTGDPNEKDSSVCGLAFSPSGRYLYVSGFYSVQQFDLQNASSSSAWTMLSGPDTTRQEFQKYSNIYPGPDGKLYIGNWNGLGGQMSVIDVPDNHGAAAAFCRKCLRFPGFLHDTVVRFAGVSIPPCMPNYSLGPANPICHPTNVHDPEAATTFTLYPNPATEAITLRFVHGSAQFNECSLFDITGRRVATTSFYRNSGSVEINVRHLANGLYHYRITEDGITWAAGKFLKQ